MYFRSLNAGIRMAATGGLGNFSNVWRDSPNGTSRTYAHVQGPFTFASWIAAVKAGHTFGTNGPLVALDINGKEPGDEIKVDGATPASFTVHTTVKALAPLEKLGIVANGVVVHTEKAKRRRQVNQRDGDGAHAQRRLNSGAGARAEPPLFSRLVRLRQTTPVYIVRNGKTLASAADASFLAAMVDEFWRSRGRGEPLQQRGGEGGVSRAGPARARFLSARRGSCVRRGRWSVSARVEPSDV